MMKKVLFVCSQNKLRSRTAEQVFSGEPGLDVMSAGLDADAINVLTPELVLWADVIFVMTKTHRNRLYKKFKPYITKQRVYCLDIPDEFEFMDPELVSRLRSLVPRYLRMSN